MLKKARLEVFRIKDLQNCIAVLSECKNVGVNDVEQAINGLQKIVDDKFTLSRTAIQEIPKNQQEKLVICPSCNKASMYGVVNREGLKIAGCKICRYSEIIND